MYSGFTASRPAARPPFPGLGGGQEVREQPPVQGERVTSRPPHSHTCIGTFGSPSCCFELVLKRFRDSLLPCTAQVWIFSKSVLFFTSESGLEVRTISWEKGKICCITNIWSSEFWAQQPPGPASAGTSKFQALLKRPWESSAAIAQSPRCASFPDSVSPFWTEFPPKTQ